MDSNNSNDWKTRTMVVGGLLGALAGVGAALLFIRTGESSGAEKPRLEPKAALQIGIGVMGVLRQIASLGEGD